MAASPGDTLAEPAALPLHSWREAARLLPRFSAGAHADGSVPFGPVLFSRGSSPAALAVTLDGLPLADAYSGQSTFELPLDAIATLRANPDGSLALLTRAAPAPGFAAHARATSEAFVPSGGSLQVPGREQYDFVAQGGTRGAAGSLGFLAAAQRRWFGDRDPRFVDSPDPRDESSALGGAGFGAGRQPANSLAGASAYGRLEWQPASTGWRLSANGAVSHDDWRESRQAYLFDIEHAPRSVADWTAGGLSFTREGTVHLDLNASLAESRYRHGDGVWFDDLPGMGYATRGGNPGIDYSAPFFFLPGHVFSRFDRRQATRAALSAAAGWSPARSHTAKLTADVRRHAVRRYSVNDFEFVRDTSGAVTGALSDGYGYDDLGRETSGGVRRPVTMSIDLSDTFAAWREGAIEAGLRLDRVDGRRVTATAFDTLSGTLQPVREANATRTFLSPHLSVAARPSDRLSVHANLRRSVVAPSPAAMAELADGWPEVSTDIEAGLTRTLLEGVRLGVTAWDREFDHYTTASGQSVGEASARGVDVLLEHRAGDRAVVTVGGTLSRTRVRSALVGPRNIAWTATTPPTSVVPADEDRPVRAFARLSAATGDDGGAPAWRRGWRFEVLARAESGVPYTPTMPYDEVTLAAVAATPTGNTNSERQPWIFTTDLGVSRPLQVGALRMEFTLQVLNALDRHNVSRVYSGSGMADETAWLATPDGQDYLAFAGETGRRLFQLAQHQSGNWERPRTIAVAVRVLH